MIGRRFTDFLSRLRKGVREEDRARLAAILELNRALAAARDRNGLLVLLLDEAVQLFGAERGFIILWHGDEKPSYEVAVAASASGALLGRRAQDAPGLLSQRIQQLGGLDAEELHAERLFLLALSRAAADGATAD